jgi:hypothetical protein
MARPQTGRAAVADREHVERLKQGVEAWNAWCDANPKIRPDLSYADLEFSVLSRANLIRADLGGCLPANYKGSSERRQTERRRPARRRPNERRLERGCPHRRQPKRRSPKGKAQAGSQCDFSRARGLVVGEAHRPRLAPAAWRWRCPSASCGGLRCVAGLGRCLGRPSSHHRAAESMRFSRARARGRPKCIGQNRDLWGPPKQRDAERHCAPVSRCACSRQLGRQR